jgi:transforming growth factor-beta-induced protein
MMKKFFGGTGALVLAIGLAACGSAPSSTTGDSTTGTGSSSGTVSGTTTTGSGDMMGTTTTGSESTVGTTTSGSESTVGTTTSGSQGTTGTSTTGQGTTGTTTSGSQGTTGTSTTGQGTTGTTTSGSEGTTGTSTTGQGTTGTTTSEETTGDLLTELAADPRFSTLASLIEQSGLAEQLEAAGPVTIFAPTNEAFAALPQATLEELAQNPTELQQVLLYHISSGSLPSSDITGDTTVTTLAGSDLDITTSNGMVMINGTAQVTEPDMMIGENVIHVIDQVLLPDTAA